MFTLLIIVGSMKFYITDLPNLEVCNYLKTQAEATEQFKQGKAECVKGKAIIVSENKL